MDQFVLTWAYAELRFLILTWSYLLFFLLWTVLLMSSLITPGPALDTEDFLFIIFCQKSVGHICIIPFLGSLVYPIYLCTYSSANTTLSKLVW